MAKGNRAPGTQPTTGGDQGFSFEPVTPAPRRGRSGQSAFPREAMDTLAEMLKRGEWAGDGQTYDTRQKANLRVTRLKRGLIHYGHFENGKEIKSRVWGSDDEGYRLAMTSKAAHAEPVTEPVG